MTLFQTKFYKGSLIIYKRIISPEITSGDLVSGKPDIIIPFLKLK
jgi:hypothetical protein